MDVVDVTSSLEPSPSRSVARGARVVAALPLALFASIACGSPPAEQSAPLDGASLVAGSSLARYGLLVIPRDGGTVEFRSSADPSTVRWTGRLALGRIDAAHSLGSAVVLRDGSRLRLYATSPTEAVSPLPQAPADARWIPSAVGGAFVGGDRIVALTATSAAEVSAGSDVLWAAPAEGGRVVALIEAEDGPDLTVWEPGEAQPAATRPAGTRGPAVLTGWGLQVVTASGDGRGLTAWSIPGLEAEEPVGTGGAPTALATSPSRHRVFAATADRARFVSIDRYSWREVGSSRIDAPFETLRSGITGGRLVAYDGARAWSVGVGGTRPEAVPGEWRADLPLALPGGGVLVSTGSGLGLLAPGTGEVEPVDGPLEAWWLPFRWGPRLPVTAVPVAADDAIRDEEEALQALADSAPSTPGRIGLLTMGTPPGPRAAVDPEAGGSPGLAGRPVPSAPPELPGGFFAVAVSSRELTSLGRMRQLLDGSGYSTHVLRRLDEANEMWYRLLVGPYGSRPEAEAVARELGRERGIDAWIHEEPDNPTARREP